MWKSTRKGMIGGFVIGSGLMWGAYGATINMLAHFAVGGAYVALAVMYARDERAAIAKGGKGGRGSDGAIVINEEHY